MSDEPAGETAFDRAVRLRRIVLRSPRQTPIADYNYRGYCQNFMRPYVRVVRGRDYSQVKMECDCIIDSALDAWADAALERCFRHMGISVEKLTCINMTLLDVPKHQAEELAADLYDIGLGYIHRRLQAAGKVIGLMVRVLSESDGKPKSFSGPGYAGATFPAKGQKDVECVVTLENGHRYKIGMKVFKVPDIEFMQKYYIEHRGFFRPFPPVPEA